MQVGDRDLDDSDWELVDLAGAVPEGLRVVPEGLRAVPEGLHSADSLLCRRIVSWDGPDHVGDVGGSMGDVGGSGGGVVGDVGGSGGGSVDGVAGADPASRRWLVIDQLQADAYVWIDGAFVNHARRHASQHCIEIPDRSSRQHLVGLDLEKFNSGWAWSDLRLETTGAVRIVECRLLVTEVIDDRAVLRVGATLDSDGTHRIVLATEITRVGMSDGSGRAGRGAGGRAGSGPGAGAESGSGAGRGSSGQASSRQEMVLARGRNELEWSLTIDRPELWWPRALGDQPLYAVTVSVGIVRGEDECEVSHSVRSRIGLRRVELKPSGRRFGLLNRTLGAAVVGDGVSVMKINGEPIFLKAASLGPGAFADEPNLGAACRRDVALAVDAGLDMLVIQETTAPAGLYDEADRQGLLICQELAGGTESVVQLGHHPSVAMWAPVDRATRRAVGDVDATRPVLADRPGLAGAYGLFWSRSRREWIDGLTRADRSLTTKPQALRRTAEREQEVQQSATQLMERQRQRKYRPAGAFCAMNFVGSARAVDAAVSDAAVSGVAVPDVADTARAAFDNERHPSPLWDALRQACRPVIVVAQLPRAATIGTIRCDVWAVSDLRHEVGAVTLNVGWQPPAAQPQAWEQSLWLGSDRSTHVVRLALRAPKPGTGRLTLHLTYTPPNLVSSSALVNATNSYDVMIAASAHR